MAAVAIVVVALPRIMALLRWLFEHKTAVPQKQNILIAETK